MIRDLEFQVEGLGLLGSQRLGFRASAVWSLYEAPSFVLHSFLFLFGVLGVSLQLSWPSGLGASGSRGSECGWGFRANLGLGISDSVNV